MTNPAQTLIRMIGFLIVVMAIAGLLFAPLFDAFMANAALNGMIIAALVIGIVFSLRQVIRLRPEVNWIETFRRQQPGLSVVATPRLLAPIANMLGEQREDKMSLSTLSLRSLLDSLAMRLDESRDLSRYLIGFFFFFWVFGTLLGAAGNRRRRCRRDWQSDH